MKIGIRFILFFEIHPLIKGGTYINSFIFNINLLLICSFSLIQFLKRSFVDYLTMTDIDVMFTYQIEFLPFLNFFFQNCIFEFAFFFISFLFLIYILIKPNDALFMKNAISNNEKEILIK